LHPHFLPGIGAADGDAQSLPPGNHAFRDPLLRSRLLPLAGRELDHELRPELRCQLGDFRSRWKDFLLASFILTGINTVTTGLFYTIPFAAVFGLCLVDTWFGPIYADAVKEEVPSVSTGREARPEADSTSPSEALSS
jgi:hypothetical protein